MFRDCSRRFEGIAVGRIDDKLSGRHYGTFEGAGFVELTVLVDVAELAIAFARVGLEPGLELQIGAAQLDEAELAPAGDHSLLERRDEFVRDRRFRGEGHDHA